MQLNNISDGARLFESPLPPEWEPFRMEHNRLVDTAEGPSSPLWYSAYFGAGCLLSADTLKLCRFWRKAGCAAVRYQGNPPDYLGNLLAFPAWLEASGLPEREALLSEYRESFLFPVLEQFVKRLRQDGYPLYAAEMERILSGSLPSGRPLDGWFRMLSESERAEPPEQVIHASGRNNCGGKCVINVHRQDGCILSLTTDEEADREGCPTIQSCVRGRGYRRTYLGPERLRWPMKRVGKRGEGKFQRISWKEAVELIAAETARIREQYGPSARYCHYATGVAAYCRGETFLRRLLTMDGGYLDRYNSYSSACTTNATPYTYGTNLSGNEPEDLLNSHYIVLWGHNPMETVFDPALQKYLQQARDKGIPIVSVDPRCTDSCIALGAKWIGLRPTTDSALASAMAYVIWSEGLQNQEFMDNFCIGFDREHMPEGADPSDCLHDYLFGLKDGIAKTPEWAEPITGVPADTIREFAREFAAARPAALLNGLGPQRNGNGEQSVRSCTMLCCLTGNAGIPGGGGGGTGWSAGHQKVSIQMPKNPTPAAIPVFLWTDAVSDRWSQMTAEKDHIRNAERLSAPIKLIFNIAGNALLNQHSDINRTAELLRDESKCEFIVVSDLFMTASAKFADLLLPGSSLFESENMAFPWESGNYVLHCDQSIEPLFESRFEYDWIRELAALLGHEPEFSHSRTVHDWVVYGYGELRKKEPELPPYEEFCRKGFHKYSRREPYVAFRKQRENPAENPFPTPSGKIEIYSPALAAMHDPLIPPIPEYIPSFEGPEDILREKYPIQLIGWHTKRRCHSIHDQNPWMELADPQKIWMNPADAQARGIRDGDLAEIWNDRGCIRMPVRCTNRIVQGVAAIAQGGWYTPDKNGVDTRGSINVLTTLRPTPLAKGNPQHTNLVEICRAESQKEELSCPSI